MIGKSICVLIAIFVCVSGTPDNFANIHQQNDRIVKGTPINITRAPWQVSLQKEGLFHFCGGSIISDQWILTAAHCLRKHEEDPTALRVNIGITNIDEDGESIRVDNVYMHPQFNRPRDDFDFGLIRLKTKITFNEKKQPIKMVDFGDADFATGTIVFASGWGETKDEINPSTQLRGAEFPIVDQNVCNKMYGGKVTSRMICAGNRINLACQGDDGGPLVGYTGENKVPVLVGIVSWWRACDRPVYPGVYARVLSGREWIYSHTRV